MADRGGGSFNPGYASMDHWRGVAALAVMVFHAFGQIRGAGLPVHPSIAWLKWLSDFGGLGVHVFFAISGYCIAANLYRLARSGGGALDFLRDRALRIYPTYWAACVAAIAMNALASPFNGVPLSASLPGDWTAAIANVLLLEPYLGNVPSILLVSWSLLFELGFYLLAGLGFAAWRMGVNAWLLLAAGFGLAVLGMTYAGGGLLLILSLWPEFASGAAVFVALWLKATNPWARWLALAPIAVFFALGSLADWQGYMHSLPVAAGFAILLYVLHPLDRSIAAAPALRAVGWAGKISYSLYLTHVPLGLRIIPLGRRWVESDSAWLWVLQALGWAAAILMAWLFYEIVEARFERWRVSLRRRPVPAPFG